MSLVEGLLAVMNSAILLILTGPHCWHHFTAITTKNTPNKVQFLCPIMPTALDSSPGTPDSLTPPQRGWRPLRQGSLGSFGVQSTFDWPWGLVLVLQSLFFGSGDKNIALLSGAVGMMGHKN